MARSRRGHGARRRRRGGAQPGLRARHRRADAAHAAAAAAGRPRRAAATRGSSASRCRPPAWCCWPRAPTGCRRRSRWRRCVIYLVDLHADEAALAAGDARRRGAGRAAAAHRLDRVARQHRSSAARALFAIVFLWQIPHFMAIAWLYRDDYAQGRLPDAAGDRARRPARRASRRCCTRRAAGAGQPGADASSGSAGPVYLAVALVLGVGAVLAGRPVRARRATTRPRARCSSGRSPTCRSLDRDDRRTSCDASTTCPPSTRAQRAVRRPAAHRLRADPARAASSCTAGA